MKEMQWWSGFLILWVKLHLSSMRGCDKQQNLSFYKFQHKYWIMI